MQVKVQTEAFVQQCLEWKRRGLIPGPNELETDFLDRVQSSLSQGDVEMWREAHQITQRCFGFSLDWVPVYFSNQKLPFWEGAATWIDKQPSIQLRKGFLKGSYLGYKRAEVLAHESVHGARCKFEEPEFEEILAYQTSSNKLRRFVGPAFQKPWESLVFVLSVGIASFGQYWLGAILSGYVGLRLYLSQRKLRLCLKKLPLSLILCLTDQEITTFAQLNQKEILAHLQQDHTFRGLFLKAIWIDP